MSHFIGYNITSASIASNMTSSFGLFEVSNITLLSSRSAAPSLGLPECLGLPQPPDPPRLIYSSRDFKKNIPLGEDHHSINKSVIVNNASDLLGPISFRRPKTPPNTPYSPGKLKWTGTEPYTPDFEPDEIAKVRELAHYQTQMVWKSLSDANESSSSDERLNSSTSSLEGETELEPIAMSQQKHECKNVADKNDRTRLGMFMVILIFFIVVVMIVMLALFA